MAQQKDQSLDQQSNQSVKHGLHAIEQPKFHEVDCPQLTDRQYFLFQTLVLFEAANIHFQTEPHWGKDHACVAAANFDEMVHTYELVGVKGGPSKRIPISGLFE